jgi:hypothetical protein
MKSRSLAVSLSLVALVACGGDPQSQEAAWLTMPSRASHARYFPIDTGSTHETAGCNDCHGAFDTFAKFDCLGCHSPAVTTPFHTGVPGYLPESPACLSCHPDGRSPPPANHPLFFPIDPASVHSAVSCRQCHTDLANPTVPANFACATCHTAIDGTLATKHTGASIPVTDFSATPEMCLKCHADSQVDAGGNHPRGDDTPSGNGDHRKAGCTKCHVDMRTDKPFGVDFSKHDGCKACH